jgi:hypothetical protein
VVVGAEEASMAVATEVEEASEAAAAAATEEVVVFVAATEVAFVAVTEVAFAAVTEVASVVDVEGLRAPRSLGKSIRGPNLRFITNATLQRRHQRSSARC